MLWGKCKTSLFIINLCVYNIPRTNRTVLLKQMEHMKKRSKKKKPKESVVLKKHKCLMVQLFKAPVAQQSPSARGMHLLKRQFLPTIYCLFKICYGDNKSNAAVAVCAIPRIQGGEDDGSKTWDCIC
ncbi:hypothetical protein SAY87_017839 [Trapa incisa]|uniref:Uncharacterized protein n=1 Tax=Trapa incisa TaxID=236973 RepID=A0AAN7LB12_9MYRT|nr:hypothetical protein SAY87_017839 [Trapa incisa]